MALLSGSIKRESEPIQKNLLDLAAAVRDGWRMKPTLLDVARAAEVSRTTASNAFNRPDQLSAALRDKVLEVARELGYAGPNPMARMLRTGRAGAIGVVFPESVTYAFTDPVAIALLQGIGSVCDREEAGVLVLSAADVEAVRRTVYQVAVDGFIMECLAADSEVVSAVLERGLPAVAVDHPGFTDAPSVEIAERAGAREAAGHLLRQGHRRIGVIALETRPDGHAGPLDAGRRAGAVYGITMERLAGYEEGLRDAGLDPATLVIEEQPGYGRAGGMAAARRVLAARPRPTAILAMSDEFALGAIEAAQGLGLQVPEDLSVVGFDDAPLAARSSPPLTTVHQPLVEKGQIAAELLFGRREASSIVLPTRLVVRGSTAPPTPA
jgi:DNA-binding LacI/PurR family transcriptional regulator